VIGKIVIRLRLSYARRKHRSGSDSKREQEKHCNTCAA
jgi:hypothetical protein